MPLVVDQYTTKLTSAVREVAIAKNSTRAEAMEAPVLSRTSPATMKLEATGGHPHISPVGTEHANRMLAPVSTEERRFKAALIVSITLDPPDTCYVRPSNKAGFYCTASD